MSQAIIFVGGIHGTGKTTLCRRLALVLSASHVTAGTLIRETANSKTTTTGIRSKAVPDVNANQELLLRGLALYRGHTSGPILLDGHFSLMEPGGTIVDIPQTVYVAIAPIALVLVEVDPLVVHSRLTGRDGTAPPLETIASLCQHERAHAELVSKALNIRIFVVRGDIPAEETSQAAASNLRPLLRGVV